jgi:hypothetical protein
MARRVFVFVLMVTAISVTYSQEMSRDSLSLEDGFFGMTYKQGDRELSSTDFRNLLKSSSDSSIYDRYSNGKTLGTLADVLGFMGGFGVGYALTSKPTDQFALIAGGVATVSSVVFGIMGKSKVKGAVEQYNRQLWESRSNSILDRLNRGTTLASVSFTIY